jgi:hypothetical protein
VALVGCLCLLVLGCGGGRAGTDGGEPPALILVITVDSLRADTLGAYGDPLPVSPAIDRLAASSHVFDRAYAPSSWTKPSMASMLSSTIVSRHLVYFSTLVRERVVDYLATRFDGDYERLYLRGNVVPDHLPLFHEFLDGYHRAAFVENVHLRPELGFARGWDHFENFDTRKVEAGVPGNADAMNRRVLEYLDARAGDRCVVWIHYFDVHWPYGPIDRYGAEFLGDALGELPRPYTMAALDRMVSGAHSPTSRMATVVLPGIYRAGIRAFDDHLAELLDGLRQRRLFDSAMVILSSDHGDEFFEHGRFGHGHNLYDTVIRIPLLIKMPGQRHQQRHPEVVSLVDVGPTVLDAVGKPTPAFGDGRSLLPLMEGTRAGECIAVSEVVNLELENLKAIAAGNHKLIRAVVPDGFEDRLFAIDDDFSALTGPGSRPLIDQMSGRLLGEIEDWDPLVLVGQDVQSSDVEPREIENLDSIIEQLRAIGYL